MHPCFLFLDGGLFIYAGFKPSYKSTYPTNTMPQEILGHPKTRF